MISTINVKDTNNQSPVFTSPATAEESIFVNEVDYLDATFDGFCCQPLLVSLITLNKVLLGVVVYSK